MIQAKDYSGLLLLFSTAGNPQGLAKLAEVCYSADPLEPPSLASSIVVWQGRAYGLLCLSPLFVVRANEFRAPRVSSVSGIPT